jgi:hypothetical protein
MKIISTDDACTEHQHLRILECQCMYMAKVKHCHIHVDTNGNVIGKHTNVVLSMALTTHPPSRPPWDFTASSKANCTSYHRKHVKNLI